MGTVGEIQVKKFERSGDAARVFPCYRRRSGTIDACMTALSAETKRSPTSISGRACAKEMNINVEVSQQRKRHIMHHALCMIILIVENCVTPDSASPSRPPRFRSPNLKD